MSSHHLFSIKDLSFSYKIAEQHFSALNKVQLSLPKSKLICLSGPSGSGKTTLLNLLGLIEPIQQGTIYFEDINYADLNEGKKNNLRRHQFGFIFQQFLLFPNMTASENVEFFLYRQGVPTNERQKRVQESLTAVGLSQHQSKKPLQMSGGQRQRVAIARALAKQPKVVIADEPTASLDQKNGKEIMGLLKKINQEREVSILLSSHDLMVQSQCEINIHLIDGAIVNEKSHKELTC